MSKKNKNNKIREPSMKHKIGVLNWFFYKRVFVVLVLSFL